MYASGSVEAHTDVSMAYTDWPTDDRAVTFLESDNSSPVYSALPQYTKFGFWINEALAVVGWHPSCTY